MAEGRTKALNQTVAQIKRRFGDGALMRLGETSHLDVEIIPTGALSLDIALGVGGLPRGRITEVYGPEGSGKTTICQHIVAQAQKLGGVAAFIDMEHALEPRYAAACGVDIESLYISQPDTGEQALEIAEALVRSGAVDVIVIDSVAALVPRAEIEGEMGDSHPGLQARLMSQALRKLSGAIKQSNAVIIFTNQLRMKIGVMFGSPETTSGGRALKFYATVRLDVRRIKSIKVKGEVIGHTTRVRVTKNKVAPPFRVAEFDIMFGDGISHEGDLLDVGLNLGILDQRGSYYYYDDDNFAQGRENSKVYFQENPEFANNIETLIREELAERNKEKEKEKTEADEEEHEDVEDGGDDED